MKPKPTTNPVADARPEASKKKIALKRVIVNRIIGYINRSREENWYKNKTSVDVAYILENILYEK